MKTKRDRARIAGALVVACLLAFACFIGLQGNSKEAAPHSFTHTPQEAALPDNGVEEGADDGIVAQTPYEDTQAESYEGYEYEPNIVLVTLPIGIAPADAVSTIIEETGITDIALANEADLTASAPTGAEAPDSSRFQFRTILRSKKRLAESARPQQLMLSNPISSTT